MRPFEYIRAKSLDDAAKAIQSSELKDNEFGTNGLKIDGSNRQDVALLAGGTTLLDLMKINVMNPEKVIDINRIGLNEIDQYPAGIRIGANVRNNDLAWHPEVRSRYPLLSEALLSGASAQLRQMATTAGNVLQKTRCPYYRDTTSACNKREPGSGCAGKNGFDRSLAVLGISDACIATHPSDMCVALMTLNAVVHTRLPEGKERKIPFGEFHLLPENTPEKENILEPGEIIQHLFIPYLPAGVKSHYLKVRDRTSYEFALASAAVVLDIEESGVIKEARIGLGGVATKPWRATEAERVLRGQRVSADVFVRAGKAAMETAIPGRFNQFKIELGQRTIVSALVEVASQFDISDQFVQKEKIA